MSTYPQRKTIVSNGSFSSGATEYYYSPQIAFQPFGRCVLGYTFTGSGTVTLAVEHRGPDGNWYAPQETTVLDGVSAPGSSSAVIDTCSFTWGTDIRWKLTVASASVSGLYIWLDFA